MAENYAENAIMLLFDANELLLPSYERTSYFIMFVEKKPQFKVDKRWTRPDCNTATYSGLYIVTVADGHTEDMGVTFTYPWEDWWAAGAGSLLLFSPQPRPFAAVGGWRGDI